MLRALITGVSGQDGAILAQILLDKGYEVYGAERRSASSEHWRLKELGILDQVKMIAFELLEYSNIVNVLEKVQPDEIYNMAAMSFVGASFSQPIFTCDANGLGVVRLLEAMRQVCPEAKFYQASSSEMFGSSCSCLLNNFGTTTHFQDERTPFHPCSPYACSKLFAHSMVVNYREAYDLFGCSGICFNHEGPLRSPEFVTRKITLGFANIYHGKQEVLELGNMDARRDWGHFEDHCRGMILMLQHDNPDDYVLATGETRSVKDFVNATAKALDWELAWEGEGSEMKARRDGKVIVQVNPEFYRPSDVEYLCGNAEKAKRVLGWEPEYTFDDLVVSMIEADVERVK